MKKHYVVGFMFSEDLQHVALIRKNRPEWQAGKLNGIGGKVEANESTYDAMVREFREETGVSYYGWKQFANLVFDDAVVMCFYGVQEGVWGVATMTDEEVSIYNVSSVPNRKTIENIPWLMHMALESHHTGRVYHIVSRQSEVVSG